MKKLVSFFLVLTFADWSHARTCADLFKSRTLATGEFVSVATITAAEARVANLFAPRATSMMRIANSPFLVFKEQTLGTGNERILVLNLLSGKVTHSIETTESKTIVVSPNGEFTFVELKDGGISVYAQGHQKLRNSVPEGWKSSGMALSGDGKTLYTFSRFYRELLIIETSQLENGSLLSHSAASQTHAVHFMPLGADPVLRPVRRAHLETSSDGQYVVVAGDAGAVVVFEMNTSGPTVIPNTAYRGFSNGLRNDFVANAQPSAAAIRWTGQRSFTITINSKTEKFDF